MEFRVGSSAYYAAGETYEGNFSTFYLNTANKTAIKVTLKVFDVNNTKLAEQTTLQGLITSADGDAERFCMGNYSEKKMDDQFPNFFQDSSRPAIAGSFFPVKNSMQAPPPVERWEYWDARPSCSMTVAVDRRRIWKSPHSPPHAGVRTYRMQNLHLQKRRPDR